MRIMAIDFGLQRTGVAVCDEEERLASPVETVAEHSRTRLIARLTALAAEYGAKQFLLGHPLNMDGTRGESALRVEQFAEDLTAATGIPVVLRDERLTTVSAIGYLNETNVRGKKRKAVVDTVSAVILLQEYIDAQNR